MPREAPGEPVRDEDPSDGALVTLTEAAAERVRELIAGAADVQLRVAIEKKGRPRHVVSLSDESEEGDVVFEVLDRINAPELRVRRMRELLLEPGFVRPGDDDPLGPLA